MSGALRESLALKPSPAWQESPELGADDFRATFDAAADFTLGLEEELMLIDPRTLALAPAIDQVLRLVDRERCVTELRQSQIELVTGVCESAAEASAELAALRRGVAEALGGRIRLAAAGTHPFSSDWGAVTEGERYREIADEYQWAATRSMACGLHVHVAIRGAERALAVYNALRSYLPELGAIAANSPFHEGRDTGLCSVRSKLNEAYPRAGVPPVFATWEELAEFVAWARRGALLPDATHFWWDLRLHPLHGTVELRVADAQTDVADTAAVAGLVHALVVHLAERWDAGGRLPAHDSHRIAENAWRGLRYGVSGWLVDLDTGEPEPTRTRLARLLDELEPVGHRIGCDDELVRARTLLGGNGADRQRYVAAREGLVGLTRWLVEETERPPEEG